MKRHDESLTDRLRRMAASDELEVGRGRAERIAARALARVEARPRQRARLVAAIVSGSAFAIVSVTGIGAVADQAVPGDSLYPVDRAYESISRAIGRDVDRTEERLEEALALAVRGDRIAAVNHVNTELGQSSPVIETDATAVQAEAATAEAATAEVALPEPATAEAATAEAQTSETAPPNAVEDSALDQAGPAAFESDPAPSPDAPEVTDGGPLAVDEDEPADDPFLLALENALRASRVAAESEDEDAAFAASEAIQSVVKLAAGQIDGSTQTEQTSPGAVTVATSTTTTVPEEVVEAVEETDSDADATTSTTVEDGDTDPTTTTVVDDSETEPPGDGETAGDDSGGSQEGSGDAGEPGDAGEEPPGPVILPIP